MPRRRPATPRTFTTMLALAALLALNLLGASSAQERTVPVCGEGMRPFDVAVGDLDADGQPDLVVGCGQADGPASGGPGHIEVLRGGAEGHGDPERLRDFEHGATAVALGDVTGDGAPDLAVNVSGPHERTLAVLPNDGAGAFGEPVRSVTDFSVSEPALADADGDGDVDVLMPARNGLFRNDGDASTPGPFAYGSLVGMGERNDVDLADVDADGRMDVAHALPSHGKIRLHATAEGTPTEVVLGKAVREVRAVLAGGDLNGDGAIDLVVKAPVDPYTSEVRLALSDGDAWQLSDALPSLGDPNGLRVGDVNGDGAADLVAAPAAQPDTDDYALRIALGRGDGTFGDARERVTGTLPYRPVLHDVTGDGLADVVYVDMEESLLRVADAPFGG